MTQHPYIAEKLFDALRQAHCGEITLTLPGGGDFHFKAANPGPSVHLHLHDWGVLPRVIESGDIALGETYVEGLWDSDDIAAFILFSLLNFGSLEVYAHGGWLKRMGFHIYNTIVRRNNRTGSTANIRSHYDVGNAFYQLWLDPTMTYSSALRSTESASLETAQIAKYGRILEHIPNAERILEIGCGWGGFAEQAARAGKFVTGITLSREQHGFATQRLGAAAEIRIQDYRDVGGTFDSIVSIEMFEAVGERYWPSYFRTLKERLKPHGTAMVQTITIDDAVFGEYRKRSDFIRHYTFPGGMLPSPSRFTQEAEKAGLAVRDTLSFGQDYAWTLRQWLHRFNASETAMSAMGYDGAFLRSWRFYLALCIGAFEAKRTDVMQVELVHA